MLYVLSCRAQHPITDMTPRSRRVLEVLGNNHKNMINRVQESSSSIMVIKKLNSLQDFG
jgi:hypothetical protein